MSGIENPLKGFAIGVRTHIIEFFRIEISVLLKRRSSGIADKMENTKDNQGNYFDDLIQFYFILFSKIYSHYPLFWTLFF